jgi:hypothetical protein
LLKAGDDLATVRAARTAADAALAALDQAVRDVDAADRAIAEGTKSLLRIRAEIDSVQKRREELAKVEGTLTEARIAAEAARRAHDELDRADAEIRDLDIRIRGAEETLRPAHEDLGCAKAAEVTQRSRFDAALVALRELTARHREAGASAERHALVEQVERQRVERAGLASRCDLIVAHRRRADEIRAEIRRLPPVKGEDVEKLVALERAADAAAAELRAIATRVEVIAADAPVRLGETSLVAGGAETITAEAEIVVGGTTRLRVVPGGGRSLAECTRKSEVAATALAERLSTLGVASTDQARRDAARLAGLANDLRAEESTVKGLGDEQALRELATLDGAIAELDARLARQGAEGFARAEGLESALVARRAADDEVHRLATALGGATTEFDVAKTLADGAVAEHARIAESIRSAQDSLAGLRTRRQAIVEKVGEERAGELASRAAALKEADDRLAVFQRQRAALEPETIERDQKRYQKSLEERQDEMRRCSTPRAPPTRPRTGPGRWPARPRQWRRTPASSATGRQQGSSSICSAKGSRPSRIDSSSRSRRESATISRVSSGQGRKCRSTSRGARSARCRSSGRPMAPCRSASTRSRAERASRLGRPYDWRWPRSSPRTTTDASRWSSTMPS